MPSGSRTTVQLLLDHGADKEKICIRTGQELRAIDFAKPSKKNTHERYYRYGGKHKPFPEDAHARDLDREAIVRLLDNTPEPSYNQDLWGFVFTSELGHGNIISLTAHFDRPTEKKTVCVMHRGMRFPPIAAMSGWSHDKIEDVRIAGKDWIPQVQRLCEATQYQQSIQPSHDHGIPGQYLVCHAEKQLIAWFVYKHMILDHDLALEVEDG